MENQINLKENISEIHKGFESKPQTKIGRKYITTLEHRVPVGFIIAENNDIIISLTIDREYKPGIWLHAQSIKSPDQYQRCKHISNDIDIDLNELERLYQNWKIDIEKPELHIQPRLTIYEITFKSKQPL